MTSRWTRGHARRGTMLPSWPRNNPGYSFGTETAATAAVSWLAEITMLFAIHALDRTNALPARLANYDAHKAFLSDTSRFGVAIVMSGPLTSDDGQTMIGSLFLIEAPAVLKSKHSIMPIRFSLQASGRRRRSQDFY